MRSPFSSEGFCALVLMLCLAQTGCTKRYPNEKPVFPVKGVVHVDGAPAYMLKVAVHSAAGESVTDPVWSSVYTNEKGEFAISTYSQNDGVPEGEYVMTFLWGELNPLSMEYGGPDKLNDRYSDPAASKFPLSVKPDSKTDLGVIELTTK